MSGQPLQITKSLKLNENKAHNQALEFDGVNAGASTRISP